MSKKKKKSSKIPNEQIVIPAEAGKMSKSDYIRSHAGKSGKEIFDHAQKDNMGLSLAHIYAVQSSDRKKANKGSSGATAAKRGPKPGAKAKAKAAAAPKKHASTSHSVGHTGDFEKQVRDIIFHVGFNGLKTMIDRIHHEIAG